MLRVLTLFHLVGIVLLQNVLASPNDDEDGIFQVAVRTNNIGRIKYEDGEVILSQNQHKPTDIFFTPFPRINPTDNECRENLLSDHMELVLSVGLYTPKLIRAVDTYMKERFSALCKLNGTCDISLLPMNAIRLVQKGLRTNKARQQYTINDEWHSNTLLLQTIEFIIYTANKSVCEKLRSSIAERCHLSNFEVRYSLHAEKAIERQVEITSEQVTNTSMFNRIRSQFSRADMVVLTGSDFKQLISEVSDSISMKVRIQEGFDSQLQEPIGLDKLLERQLQFKQVQLNKLSDQLWDSLYWTPELTRPDRLAKAINTVVRKNSTDGNHFLYDCQAAKNIHKLDLNQHDIDRFEQLDKLLTNHQHSSSSSNTGGGSFQASGGLSFLGLRLGGSGDGLCQLGLGQTVVNITKNISGNNIYLDALQGRNVGCSGVPQFFFAYQSADSEKYSVGQILGGISQASSVLEMNSRVPTICVLSSQSTWSHSAITLAGNSAGISGSDGSHLNTPIPFYYDQPNNLIIVGDNGNSRVIQFHLNNPSSNGTVIAGGNGYSCTSLNQFHNTVGIALDSSRHLYVSDSGCSRILMFPPNSNSSTFGHIFGGYDCEE
ncbi:unnamed protein product [Adineta steineri]|uniref:Uncharacterized protein n=1 Tax=Adineta steineri TaxID=433720 RepID=A0A814X703_9BILA|nr:unnamed protein product [Adineta steineri]